MYVGRSLLPASKNTSTIYSLTSCRLQSFILNANPFSNEAPLPHASCWKRSSRGNITDCTRIFLSFFSPFCKLFGRHLGQSTRTQETAPSWTAMGPIKQERAELAIWMARERFKLSLDLGAKCLFASKSTTTLPPWMELLKIVKNSGPSFGFRQVLIRPW